MFIEIFRKMLILNVFGLRASGQTTIKEALVKRHGAGTIKRATDRPPRRGEPTDYIHMDRMQFAECVENKEIIEGTLRAKVEQDRAYCSAILVPCKWHWVDPRVPFCVSMFGTASEDVKRVLEEEYGIKIFNIHLLVPPWIRRERLEEKEQLTGISFQRDRDRLVAQPSKEELELFVPQLLEAKRTHANDLVIVNDGTVDEAVEKIEEFFNLIPSAKNQRYRP